MRTGKTTTKLVFAKALFQLREFKKRNQSVAYKLALEKVNIVSVTPSNTKIDMKMNGGTLDENLLCGPLCIGL